LKRYILDSGIVNDLINRRHGVDVKAKEARKKGDRLGVGTPVVGELLAGLENSANREKNLARLERLLSRLAVWPYDEASAR
jgi:predicted nucleic acid-binding protein